MKWKERNCVHGVAYGARETQRACVGVMLILEMPKVCSVCLGLLNMQIAGGCQHSTRKTVRKG